MSKKEKKSYVIKHYCLFERADKNNKIVRRWPLVGNDKYVVGRTK